MLRLGVASARRHRPYMEDRWVAGDVEGASLIGVFDGHEGSVVAEHAAATALDAARSARQRGLEIDAFWLDVFKRIDAGTVRSGSTATILMVSESRLSAAWVGDSRAVLVRGDAHDVLTPDHRIQRADELRRCLDAGATLMPPYVMDPVSSYGLMMTRALGDAGLRSIGIIPEPEVVSLKLDGTAVGVVVATDGLWDVVDNGEAADVVRGLEPQRAADRLVELVTFRNGGDNVTVVVARF